MTSQNQQILRHQKTGKTLTPIKIGSKYGTLTVTGRAGKRLSVSCECGTIKSVYSQNLVRAKSCGCLTSKILSDSAKRHGDTDSPAWTSWKLMLERCEKTYHKSYADYGGRGIKVCDRWHTYENFRSDMGERPLGLQLDRINNDGNYEPGNCRWVTPKENSNNRRNSRRIDYAGASMSVEEWAKVIGIPYTTLSKRVSDGWDYERALTTPLRPDRRRLPGYELKPIESVIAAALEGEE